MELNFTNRLFVAFFALTSLLNPLHCAWSPEHRHRVLTRPPRGHDSSRPLTELHHQDKAPLDWDLPYLQLPEWVDSRVPLVDPEHFEPSLGTGTGDEALPEPIQELLRPGTTEPLPTEPQPDASVRMDCKHNRMFVEVDRAVLGSSDPKRALRLGNCSFTKITEDYVYFELELTDCRTNQTNVADRVVFSNVLRFEPDETQSPIRRTAPFTVDLSCHFNRYHYSYLMAFKPKPLVQNLFKRMRNREKFTLAPKNAQWEPLSPSEAFTLGTSMFFEAQTELLSSGQRLYVHSCFATPEPSAFSTPSFSVVSNYGCMVESKDGRSHFIPSANNVVRFAVDAFHFKGFEGNTLYMHCTMSVGPYFPTATDKSCNYHSDIGRWVELNGSDTICSCCESSCGPTASSEAVISSKVLNIDVKPKQSARKKRPKNGASKRKSKSPSRVSRPKAFDPEERAEAAEGEPISEAVRWAVAAAEPLEVAGSAVVEEIKEPEKRRRPLIFEEFFGLPQYDLTHDVIKV